MVKKALKTLDIAIILGFILGCLNGSIHANAQDVGPGTIPIKTQSTNSEYLSIHTITTNDGKSLEEMVISGPPNPPSGHELERVSTALPQPDQAMGINTLTVPAYNWVFGCSAVSGAMIAAYYDRNGFSNIYTGPTNGGIMPLDNSLWSSWTDGAGSTYPNNPLVATHNGVDGRTMRGSIDNYWVSYGSSAADPYITNGWSMHTWGDAIGDYMKTSQSNYSNTDGATHFYNWTSSSSPLTCVNMETYGIDDLDGTYGRKLFYEARGYTVTDCYNQKTDNNGGGFTYAKYQAEIDAGRPVLLNLAGHSIIGVGYDNSTNTVYIHDTWDYLSHSMAWGGSYAGMTLLSVSIVNVENGIPDDNYEENDTLATAYDLSTMETDWLSTIDGNGIQADSDWYQIFVNPGDEEVKVEAQFTHSEGNIDLALYNSSGTVLASSESTTDDESIDHVVPAGGINYYISVYGGNQGNLYDLWWDDIAPGTSPGAFDKTAPANGETSVLIDPTLTWDSSSGAERYVYCYDTTDDNTCSNWTDNGTNTSVVLSGLSPNTSHYWHVRAVNSIGTTYSNGSSTAFWSFTTLNNPPNTPSNPAPADGAIDQALNVNMSWTGGDPDGDTVTYDVYFEANDNTPDILVSNDQSGTTYDPVSLTTATPYCWQIVAADENGESSNGPIWCFTTLNNPPDTPSNPSPAVGAVDQVLNVNMSWTGGDPDGDTVTYDVYFEANDNTPDLLLCKDILAKTCDPGTFIANTHYFWYVVAMDEHGVSSSGPVWDFTTLSTEAQDRLFLPIVSRNY